MNDVKIVVNSCYVKIYVGTPIPKYNYLFFYFYIIVKYRKRWCKYKKIESYNIITWNYNN